jgi:Immunoglobulin-like domain of bacterial spore germination
VATDAILGVMNYAIGLVIALAGLTLAGCSGGGSVSVSVPSQLANVCTQNASAAVDAIQVSSPTASSGVQSPLKVTGTVNSTDGLFFIAVVLADGTHIIDYPGHSSQGGSLAPFSQQVPFSIFQSTPACLWVYPQNVPDPIDGIRIPIVLEPGSTSTATPAGS